MSKRTYQESVDLAEARRSLWTLAEVLDRAGGRSVLYRYMRTVEARRVFNVDSTHSTEYSPVYPEEMVPWFTLLLDAHDAKIIKVRHWTDLAAELDTQGFRLPMESPDEVAQQGGVRTAFIDLLLSTRLTNQSQSTDDIAERVVSRLMPILAEQHENLLNNLVQMLSEVMPSDRLVTSGEAGEIICCPATSVQQYVAPMPGRTDLFRYSDIMRYIQTGRPVTYEALDDTPSLLLESGVRHT